MFRTTAERVFQSRICCNGYNSDSSANWSFYYTLLKVTVNHVSGLWKAAVKKIAKCSRKHLRWLSINFLVKAQAFD